ncbi:MAG: TRAP transporter substrate-binding protein [Deltaproteobacteria bacterium]|nr:TRAP transporter substrate-binding protein [Deltaproteobacteria bacterium]
MFFKSFRCAFLFSLLLAIFSSVEADEVKPADVIKLRMATVAPEGTPWAQVVSEVGERIVQKTGGKMKIRAYLGGQLGGEVESLEGTQLGTIHIWAGSLAAFEGMDPQFGVFDLPFLWQSDDEVYYVLDNVLKEPLFKRLDALGLKGVAWSENGWRHFANKKKPIHTVADVREFKWRSQESQVHVAFWKALGAPATPIAITELFNALQMGIVDATENSLVMLSATGVWETLKYLTLSYHIYQPAVIVINKKAWEKIPEEYRNASEAEFIWAQSRVRELMRNFEPELLEAYQQKGFKINKLTPEEKMEFMKQTAGVQGQFRDRFKETLPLIEKALIDYRAKKKAP